MKNVFDVMLERLKLEREQFVQDSKIKEAEIKKQKSLDGFQEAVAKQAMQAQQGQAQVGGSIIDQFSPAEIEAGAEQLPLIG